MTEKLALTINGMAYTVEIDSLAELDKAATEVRVNGRAYTVELPQKEKTPAQPTPAPVPVSRAPAPKPAAAGPAVAGQKVTAPMPGKILSVLAQVGDRVQARDTLCTLEAMKMEMNIASPIAGTVREVRAQVGANVVHGDLLFVIE